MLEQNEKDEKLKKRKKHNFDFNKVNNEEENN